MSDTWRPVDDPVAARSAFVPGPDGDLPGRSRVGGASGPLAGIRFAVKDLIDVAGRSTGGGREMVRAQPASADASVVTRCLAAGAVPVGKTRTDEWGLGTFTPGVRNPFDASRTVGGSSGGSAVAVATGAAAFALVTDTAGSARIPAAAAGVAGLCAAADWNARDGVLGLSDTVDRLGLIAATGADLAELWRALSGAVSRSGVRRVRVLDDRALGVVAEPWRRAAQEASRRLAQAWDLPPVSAVAVEPLAAFGPARATVITADAARRYRPERAVTASVRAQLAAGARVPAPDLIAARAQLDALGAQLREAIGDDLLVLPTLPDAPPRWSELDTVAAQLRAIGRMTRLTGPVNSSGLVAVSVPCGRDEAGLPLGVQVVSGTEASALAAAETLSPQRRLAVQRARLG